MAKTRIKKNDMVAIITGAAKGKTGRVLSVDRDGPGAGRRNQRASQDREALAGASAGRDDRC